MTSRHDTEAFASELQSLREVIPHAKALGAEQTNISVELLARLLKMHDAMKNSAEPAPAPAGLTISQDNVEHLLHARTELTRVSQSPKRVRLALATRITAMLSPAIANMAGKTENLPATSNAVS